MASSKALLGSITAAPPKLHGAINLEIARNVLISALQDVLTHEGQDKGGIVLLIESALYEPLIRSYLKLSTTPEGAFEALSAPVKHCAPLESTGLSPTTKAELKKHARVAFLVRGTPHNAQRVAQYIHETLRLRDVARAESSGQPQAAASSSSGNASFWVAAYPDAGPAFKQVFELANVTAMADTKIRIVPTHYFPLDTDVMTMHNPCGLKNLLVYGDVSMLHDSAKALLEFGRRYGLPHRIQAVGVNAVTTAKLFGGFLEEKQTADGASLTRSNMPKWILFDRMADPLTPLLSQQTFEGVLDDTANVAAKGGHLLGKPKDDNITPIPVLLHSNTAGWPEWRERHAGNGAQELSQRVADDKAGAKDLRDQAPAKVIWDSACKAQMLKRVLDVISRPLTDELAPGGAMASRYRAELDCLIDRKSRAVGLFGTKTNPSAEAEVLDLILEGAPLELCLRRLLLTVMFRGPLGDSHAECAATLLDTFGHQHILTLTNLEAAGFFTQKPGDSSLAAVRPLFNKAEETNGKAPANDLSIGRLLLSTELDIEEQMAQMGPYGHYRPISSLLIQHALSTYMPAWAKQHLQRSSKCQGQENLLQDVFGSFWVTHTDESDQFHIVQQDNEKPIGRVNQHHDIDAEAHTSMSGGSKGQTPVLIVMIGGCTLAEMSSIRAVLADKHMAPVFLTTDIMSADRFMRTFIASPAELATLDAAETMASRV